ncbi:MAG: hypothetical protein LBR41_03505, partial [Rickettsiales bacterium]|nr:hypothetical protein [Rickettsiales bacterium]
YGVKIGFTSFTPDIGKDPFYKADSKLYYVLRGIHLNNVKPYHGDKRDVPFVSLDDLINYHTLEAVERKINHVRQDLVGLQSMPPKNSNDYIPIIKHYHVLMKIGLLLNRVEVEGYDQVYNEFYSILSDHNFIKLPRMLDVFADLTSNDYAVILNSIELFTNQFSEFNRARG